MKAARLFFVCWLVPGGAVACGGKIGLMGPKMLRMVAGSVVCSGEFFVMGSLDKLIIITSTLLVCYWIFSCLFRVKY